MRAWDKYDTYLFDIDGTLLRCQDAVHYFGFCEALTSIAGRPLNLDGVVTEGNVDIGILRDAFALAQVPEATWRPHIAAIRNALCDYVEAHASEFRITVLPSVPQVLTHLYASGATLGLATGNLERIGWAKLSACDLRSYFHFGGFSDLYETRAQVFAGAHAQATALNPSANICVLGDTPADVLAAHAIGLDIIAVATGPYSYEALKATNPDRLVRSFNDLLT